MLQDLIFLWRSCWDD